MAGKEGEINMVYQPKRKYEWWDGYSRVVDANTVGGVVEQLEEKYGQVTRENFLEASRPDDSPTHALFEFDDSVAAEKYRLDQSATIIRSLRVIYVNKDKEEIKVSAFVNVNPGQEKAAYESIELALKDESKRSIILNKIKGELDAFINRNQHIEELADILEEGAIKVRKRGKK
jgi:hypothetical protein